MNGREIEHNKRPPFTRHEYASSSLLNGGGGKWAYTHYGFLIFWKPCLCRPHTSKCALLHDDFDILFHNKIMMSSMFKTNARRVCRPP